MRFIKKVSDRGNMTLPTELREALGIGVGDIVEFEVIGIVKKGRTTTPNGNHAFKEAHR